MLSDCSGNTVQRGYLLSLIGITLVENEFFFFFESSLPRDDGISIVAYFATRRKASLLISVPKR